MSQSFNRGGRFQKQFPGGGQPTIRIGGPLTPVVKYFIIANVAVFIFTMLLSNEGRVKFFGFFGLVPDVFWSSYTIWQLVTFNFLHSGLAHVFFNLFAIWIFGGDLERKFGKRRFIIFMAIAGIGAGVSMLITSPGLQVPVVGASGIVYGILLAYGVTYPNRIVYVYFLFPIKVKYLVLIFGGLEFLASVTGSQSGIAHLAHLGGMLFGGLYLYWDRIYMRLRERYYREKLKKFKKKYTVINNDKKDDDVTYH